MANALWPDLTTVDVAKQSCKHAAVAAFIVAGITGIVAAIAVAGTVVIPGIDAWAFVDAGVFALLGFFVMRCSRIAAVITLLVFVVERLMMLASGGIAGLPVALILIVYLIGGVRGSFAYHRLSKQQDVQAKAAGGPIG
jgi:hypothetical protein